MPVVLTIPNQNITDTQLSVCAKNPVFITKCIWSPDLAPRYVSALDNNREKLTLAKELIQFDFESSLDCFNQYIKSAAECMVRKIKTPRDKKSGALWFDRECRQAKSNF